MDELVYFKANESWRKKNKTASFQSANKNSIDGIESNSSLSYDNFHKILHFQTQLIKLSSAVYKWNAACGQTARK